MRVSENERMKILKRCYVNPRKVLNFARVFATAKHEINPHLYNFRQGFVFYHLGMVLSDGFRQINLLTPMSKRLQLTLFLNTTEASQIETIRERFNPTQFHLIPAHVTLCRETELTDLETVLHRLNTLAFQPFRLDFDTPIRVENGKGVLLPCLNEAKFHELRNLLLPNTTEMPSAHITLMHPRNATCTDAIFAEIRHYPLPTQFHFATICLIQQENGGKWEILQSVELK